MAKIYNEVVIDMNPESPTFEETLHEDSYEYEGDMMLAQGDPFSGESVYYISVPAVAATDTMEAVPAKWSEYKWKPSEQKFATMRSGLSDADVPANAIRYNTKEEFNAATGATTSGGVTKFAKGTGDYGLESLSKKDFFEEDGTTPKSKAAILALIKQHKPDVSDAVILAQIEDMMPKLQGVSEEEKGFIEKERGFAERTAEMGREADMYGLQKQAGAMGSQMRGAYGGMGGGARGAIGGQAGIKKGAGLASDKYGLGMEKAAFAEEKGMYGLEQGQEAEFESNIGTWLSGFKQGGRVPSKETFLDVLSKIPDAGGS